VKYENKEKEPRMWYVGTNGEFWLLLVFFCFNEQIKGHLLTNWRQFVSKTAGAKSQS